LDVQKIIFLFSIFFFKGKKVKNNFVRIFLSNYFRAVKNRHQKQGLAVRADVFKTVTFKNYTLER